MSSQGSTGAETVAKRPWQLPTIGGKYFALAVLFSMNLLNYVDRYSFFAAGTHIKATTQHRRLLVRLARRVVHDRIHDCFAFHGMAGRSLQSQAARSPAAWACGAWRRSGRHFPLITITCFSGELCWGSARRATA